MSGLKQHAGGDSWTTKLNKGMQPVDLHSTLLLYKDPTIFVIPKTSWLVLKAGALLERS